MSDTPQFSLEESFPAVDAPHVEVGASTELQLAEAQAALETAQQDVLYARAETETARRRAVEELDKARKFAIERFALELLAVKDSLERALEDNSSADTLKSGVELTLKQLNGAFEKFNLDEIAPAGEKLDPHSHQAMSVLASDQHEPNTVIEVMQKGYRLAGRVIRPALVVVAGHP